MTRWDNRLARYRNNPRDVSFEEIKGLLEAFGFEVKNYSGGSHFSVSHPQYDVIKPMEPNSIPMNKPSVRDVYVKRAIKWIDSVREMQKAEEVGKDGKAKNTDG